MPNLEIKQVVRDRAVVVAVAGDIDTATVDTLARNLAAAMNVASTQSHKLLVVDLGDVTYFGSAGLNAVLGCYEAGADNGVAVRLVANAAEVLRPLQVTQLDSVLRPYPTVPDALADSADNSG
ncbi:STAS domain-containing protein [Mycobacterium sp. ACS1612]|uniref:STAS domain-containing protein n=1 Tax=Mycobacterium sp. ACS1612 TaxID=1834117 RepID=UPI001E3FA0B7|nr:STAS domain-containing protein [Mycobacterium sp. ACS1612]